MLFLPLVDFFLSGTGAAITTEAVVALFAFLQQAFLPVPVAPVHQIKIKRFVYGQTLSTIKINKYKLNPGKFSSHLNNH